MYAEITIDCKKDLPRNLQKAFEARLGNPFDGKQVLDATILKGTDYIVEDIVFARLEDRRVYNYQVASHHFTNSVEGVNLWSRMDFFVRDKDTDKVTIVELKGSNPNDDLPLGVLSAIGQLKEANRHFSPKVVLISVSKVPKQLEQGFQSLGVDVIESRKSDDVVSELVQLIRSGRGRTISEQLFENYLVSQGFIEFRYEKSFEGKSKKPDYALSIRGKEYIFDVREFDFQDISGYGAYDSYIRVREKIKQSARKFEEYKEYPCCLVLYKDNAPLVDIESPEVMLGAMYGDYDIDMNFAAERGANDPGSYRLTLHDRGGIVSPDWPGARNKATSAVITLRYVAVGQKRLEKYIEELSKNKDVTPADYSKIEVDFDKRERQLGVIVWENAHAEIPFPRELFCGPYDATYGREGNVIRRIFVGAGLQALEQATE